MILFLRCKVQALRLAWPASLFVMLLQRTPVVRFFAEAEFVSGARLGQLLRAALPFAASLGAVHTLTGQSQMVFNPESPVSGTTGESLTVAFAFTGGVATPESYAIVGTLPPGMFVSGGSGPPGNIMLNGSAGTITGVPTTAGSYTVQIEAFDGPNLSPGTYGSSGAVLLAFNIASGNAPPPAPTITSQPVGMTALQGAGAFFAILASGSDVTYQWRRDGVDLPGKNSAALILSGIGPGDAGDYTVRVSNPGGAVESNAAALNVAGAGSARLVNLSARARVGTGGDVLIPGFIIGGSGDKTVLVRAVGPRLDDFGVAGFLGDPTMQLFRGGTAGEANDDWQEFPDQTLLENTRAAEGAFALTPSSQPLKDAAMVVNLAAGSTNYTVKTSGVGDTSGVALVELYDADASGDASRFINISARAVVGTDSEVLIPGFFIEGNVALTLMIRGVGPTLHDSFNLNGVLADPVMTLYRITDPATGASEPMTVNDDWGQGPDVAALEAARVATLGFPLTAGSADAAMLVTLNPGGYTVKVEGKNRTAGIALMEIYLVGP